MTKLTNQEVLTRAVEQAVENGWDFNGRLRDHVHNDTFKWRITEYPAGDTGEDQPMLEVKTFSGKRYYSRQSVIYDQEFARYFWGDKEICSCGWEPGPEDKDWKPAINEYRIKAYDYHRQQQVISSNPIQYLTKGLK